MDLFFKLAPSCVTLLTSAIGEYYENSLHSNVRQDMNFRLYSTSTLILAILTVTQVARGDYSRALNVSLISCYLNVLMTDEISGFARKINPLLILLLTRSHW